jgi:uncharacterized iron-regulated membrane protein
MWLEALGFVAAVVLMVGIAKAVIWWEQRKQARRRVGPRPGGEDGPSRPVGPRTYRGEG